MDYRVLLSYLGFTQCTDEDGVYSFTFYSENKLVDIIIYYSILDGSIIIQDFYGTQFEIGKIKDVKEFKSFISLLSRNRHLPDYIRRDWKNIDVH